MDRLKQFNSHITELGISASPDNGINISLMDEEIAYWFKQANVAQVSIAIESGSERMLKEVIRKPLELKQVKPVVDLLRKYDIVSTGNFICGMPSETPDDRELTEKFIEDYLVPKEKAGKAKTIAKIPRNFKLAMNTFNQAAQMVEQTGVVVKTETEETDDAYIITISLKK